MTGALLISSIKKSLYSRIMLFMVGLAIGSLSGSAFFTLIPEAFGLGRSKETFRNSAFITLGVYMFFILEWFIKFTRRNEKKRDDQPVSLRNKPNHIANNSGNSNSHQLPISQGYPDYDANSGKAYSLGISEGIPTVLSGLNEAPHVLCNVFEYPDNSDDPSNQGLSNSSLSSLSKKHNNIGQIKLATNKNCCKPKSGKGDNGVATVAYMILIGDGLHNFIDGLTLSMEFSHSLIRGISIAIAIVCEELPHELGDFAILLNSGMSRKRALLCNLFSASTIFLGMIVGMFVGEFSSASHFIFGLAAGMFLYISLVDMMPELSSSIPKSQAEGTLISTFFLQYTGILLGLTIMLLLARYDSYLSLENSFAFQSSS